MEPTETCLFCGRPYADQLLGVWFVQEQRWPVHTECWIDAYRSSRLPEAPIRRSA
jgi:hypothetical protein